MTIPVVILAVVVLMGLATAWLLLRRSETPDLVADSRKFAAQAASLDRYRVMSRLLAREDADYICRQDGFGPETRNWFRSRRRRIVRSYLHELRSDFVQMWSVCRLLTPYVEDPEFGTVLLQQWLSFHCSYGLLWLRLSSNPASEVRVDTDQLVTALRALRENARGAMRATERLAYQSSSSDA